MFLSRERNKVCVNIVRNYLRNRMAILMKFFEFLIQNKLEKRNALKTVAKFQRNAFHLFQDCQCDVIAENENGKCFILKSLVNKGLISTENHFHHRNAGDRIR